MSLFLNFSSNQNLRNSLNSSYTGAFRTFQIIGNIFALIFFASPLFQIYIKKLYRNEDIKKVPLFLILTIIFNCLFWLLNALCSDDLNDWIPLLISNIGGLIINIVLLFFYLYIFLDKKIKEFLGFGFFVINLIVEVTYLTFRYIIKKDSDTFHLVGFVATIINVLMYSSPATNIKILIKEGKYDALPIYTLFSGFLVTLSFFVQGIISFFKARDENNSNDKRNAIETMISNGISFSLLSCLVCIYSYYYFYPSRPKKVEVIDINKGNIDDSEITGENH